MTSDARKLQERSEAFRHLRKDSDRAVGIVAAAFVEDELEQCIHRHFHDGNQLADRVKFLFGIGAPLGAFSTKIDVGGLIGIYSQETWRQLVIIKDIRNRFAHWMDANSFEHQSIKTLCENLRQPPIDMRGPVNILGLLSSSSHASEYTFGDTGFTFTYYKDIQSVPSLRERYITVCIQYVGLLAETDGRVHAPRF